MATETDNRRLTARREEYKMFEDVEKIRIKLPPTDLVLTADVIRGWEAAGFRIRLVIDENGYLVEEPKYMDGTVVPKAPGSQDYTSNNSCIGYRVRLRPQNVDPPDNSSDPKGCRLIVGKWY